MKEMIRTKKLLRQQLLQLSEESENPTPEHECDYAYAMVAVSRELFKYSWFFFVILCFGTYFVCNFTAFIAKCVGDKPFRFRYCKSIRKAR